MASFEGATVAAILLTLIWFPLQVLEYKFVPLLCYSIMITMAAMFLWHKGAELMNRFGPPRATDLRLPESTCRYLFEQTNLFLGKFFEISSGKDLKLLVVAMAGLYMLSAIGNYFSPLTLLYICILFVATVPALYAEYGAPVDALVAPGIEEARLLYQKFQINVLDKIPRGLMKARIH